MSTLARRLALGLTVVALPTFAVSFTLLTSTPPREIQGDLLEATATQAQQIDVPIPDQSEWTDYGVVLHSGATGAWDDGLGAAPSMSSIVKKGEIFYLYYVGFDGYRSSDDGERHRAIGVATSTDGVTFTKYDGNPVITHLPHNNEEESAGGMAALLDSSGEIALYWAAADAGNSTSTSVDSDIRLSASSDGFEFTDLGDVLSHSDRSVWGYGDELFPLSAYQRDGRWYLYYIAKGVNDVFWDLGLAQGATREKLPGTRGVLNQGTNIFGGGSLAWVGPDTYALFIVRDNGAPYVEVRLASSGDPHDLSNLAMTYNFDNFWEASVFLDRERQTWFMYYLAGADGYLNWTISLKLAPAGERDTTPPDMPPNLSAVLLNSNIELSWGEASDPDTGIISYSVYRDGTRIGTTRDLHYTDAQPPEEAEHEYQVSAVNFHGVEGSVSTAIAESGLPPDQWPNLGAPCGTP